MPSSVPPILAPYLQSCLYPQSLALITSVLETPANWVVLRLIKAALFGVDDDVGTSQSSDIGSSVVFVSFLRSYDFWIELGRKIVGLPACSGKPTNSVQGIDLSALLIRKQVAYVDAVTIGLNAPLSNTKVIKPKSHSLQDTSNAIVNAKLEVSQHSTLKQHTTLIIDGLDLILATRPDLNPTILSTFITENCEKFSNVVLTLSADSPLLHNVEAFATPLELEHSIFLRMVAHQSAWIFQLRPLETGHAKDVSGVLQISRGGADAVQDNDLPDGEWLYQVKGDGSVKVWSRGE